VRTPKVNDDKDGTLMSIRRIQFGARIRAKRQERKLSLNDLAALLGCTKQYVSQLELGQRPFSRIQELAVALGVTQEEVLGWKDACMACRGTGQRSGAAA
jgi:transcriptional regulator with XRE-family HTH domain